MKTINNIKTPDMTAIKNSQPHDIAAQFAAKRAAEEAYKGARKAFIKTVADTLNAAPEGTVIFNADLARMCGISASHMASLMDADGYDMGIRSEAVEVAKRYAEIDENGHIIENAAPLVIRKYRCAYRKANSRGW